jgi:hypothetical protein
MMNETDPCTLGGLCEEEAASRLMKEGYNELPSSKRRSIIAIAFEVIREPMFLLLVFYLTFLRGLFHFIRLHPMDLALCLASGRAGVLWFEILKVFRLRGQQIAPLC